jgi:hypothetical protein
MNYLYTHADRHASAAENSGGSELKNHSILTLIEADPNDRKAQRICSPQSHRGHEGFRFKRFFPCELCDSVVKVKTQAPIVGSYSSLVIIPAPRREKCRFWDIRVTTWI